MEYILKNTDKDQTDKIREIITSNNEIELEGEAIANGITEEDLATRFPRYDFIGDSGWNGVFRIEGKKDFTLTSKNGARLYKNKLPFPLGYDFGRRHHDKSYNSTFKTVDSENVIIENITVEGFGLKMKDRYDLPDFDSLYEFEHGFESQNTRNLLYKNCTAKNILGDGFYFRGQKGNENISIIDCKVDFNGRQVVGIGGVKNLYIDNLQATGSGRGGVDIEPPTSDYYVENVIIKNSYFKTYLLPFPFGGRGVVENILVENNKNFCRNTQYYAVADKVNTIRKNLIYRNNERLSSHGSNSAQSAFIGVENLLIEGEKSMVEPDREQKWLFLQNCDNVVIRGCDIKNAKYIHLRDMKPEQVKLYDCEQDFIFVVERYDGEMLEVPSLEKYRANFGEDKSYRVSYGGISLEEDPAKGEDADFEWRFDYGVYERWLQSRTYVVEEIPVEEYDVKKHGEPEVPKDPDFVPYMGKVEEKPEPTPEPEEPVESKPDPVEPEPQPETPDGGGQEETPGFPEDDPKEKPETPKSEEVAKAWYKNKFIIAGAIIAIVILLIILL